jgi:feruloyl esterase
MNRNALNSTGPLAGAFTALVLMAAAPALANPGAAACTDLAKAAFPHTALASAKEIPASDSTKTPAFCEVTGVVSPVADSHIQVVYRLPDDWNGKLLGLGGGGWAGNTRLETAAPGLAKGYATAQTDAGHSSTSVWDTSWAASQAEVDDFAHRAIHLMTSTGKSVLAKYYGQAQKRAYFQGCSTGGRQALMEVQRYPDDYDGVISGAPVYTLTTQTMALLRSQAFSQPGASLSEAAATRLNDAVLAACDTKDGIEDGIITDPRSCKFDPAVIQCKPGESDGKCLTPAQVTAVRTVYAGVKAPDGEYASFPLSRGSEGGWSRFIATDKPADQTALATTAAGAGLGGLVPRLFGVASFDLTRFSAAHDFATVRKSAFAKEYEAKSSNIGPFFEHGGKLILWHGFDDPGPSPLATIEYYQKVEKATGAAANSDLRFYLLPGVYHCRGGPGADQFDSLAAIDAWVDQGKAPETLLATRADHKLSRPLCRYPALPHYKGGGDPRSAESFECRAPGDGG